MVLMLCITLFPMSVFAASPTDKSLDTIKTVVKILPFGNVIGNAVGDSLDRAKTYADFFQYFSSQYMKAAANNDILGMIQAARAADTLRVLLNNEPLNGELIKRLESKLQAYKAKGTPRGVPFSCSFLHLKGCDNMASVQYKTYGPNTDYAKTMKDYLTNGGKTADLQYQQLQSGQAQKILGASADELKQWGVTPTAIDNAMKFMPSSSGVSTGINPYAGLNSGTEILSNGKINVPNDGNPNWNTSKLNPVIDYSSQIHGIYDPLKQADLTAIRSAYDQAVSGYNAQRPLQDQYKTASLNTNDANYYNSLGGLNAAMEAGGQRGGENITGNVALQTMRGNGVNQTNQTYQNNLSAIDEAVRQAESNKASQESQVGNKWDSQIAQAIQQAQQQGIGNAQSLAGLTGTFVDPSTGIKTPTLALNEYNNKATDAALQRQLDTISQYSADYQAEINKRQAVNPNDPLIPYLATARAQKLQAQTAAEQKAAAAKTAAQQTAYENALKLWTDSGTATANIAAILGVPVGAKTASYDIAAINAATSAKNASANMINANKSSTPKTSYKDSAAFQTDYSGISQNAKGSVAEVIGKSDALIKAYTIDGYNALLNYARSVDPDYIKIN